MSLIRTSTSKGHSKLKEGRLHILTPMYGTEESTRLLNTLPNRGNNRFDEVIERINKVNGSSGKEREYNQAINDAFSLQKAYTDSEISTLICSARSKHKLAPFKGSIHKQCVNELLRLFLVTTEMKTQEGQEKARKHYTPTFAYLRS